MTSSNTSPSFSLAQQLLTYKPELHQRLYRHCLSLPDSAVLSAKGRNETIPGFGSPLLNQHNVAQVSAQLWEVQLDEPNLCTERVRMRLDRDWLELQMETKEADGGYAAVKRCIHLSFCPSRPVYTCYANGRLSIGLTAA